MFGKKSYWMPWLLVALTWPACPASRTIYDFASVAPGTLEPAEALAAEIFARAGIAIRLDTATSVDGNRQAAILAPRENRISCYDATQVSR
jgi:hypothetical protein